MKIGYARVSSTDQDLSIQIETLEKNGCEKIFQEKVSGTSTQGRNELKDCLEFVREGDELVITRVDRLARSILDLQLIIKDLEKKRNEKRRHLFEAQDQRVRCASDPQYPINREIHWSEKEPGEYPFLQVGH